MSGSEEDLEENMPVNIPPVSSSAAQGVIEELQNLFDERMEKIDFFLEKSDELYNAKDALQVIMELNPSILDRIEQLQSAYVDASKQRFVSPFLGNVLAVVVLLLFLVLAYLIIRINQVRTLETKQRLEETEKDSQRNQEAILRLLSEMRRVLGKRQHNLLMAVNVKPNKLLRQGKLLLAWLIPLKKSQRMPSNRLKSLKNRLILLAKGLKRCETRRREWTSFVNKFRKPLNGLNV